MRLYFSQSVYSALTINIYVGDSNKRGGTESTEAANWRIGVIGRVEEHW